MDCGAREQDRAGWCKVTTASFTYLGASFDTPNGSRGFIAANDGSGTVDAKSVIIAGGTEQEREGIWLEFSPDDAIGLAQGIIDAAEHAKGGVVSAGSWTPPDSIAHIPAPDGATQVDSWYEDADGNWRRPFIGREWLLVTESSKDFPGSLDVWVGILGLQESSGCISAGITVDAGSQLNSVEARKLAAMLMDAADALDGMGQ
jgi:hypothetical protein